MGPVLIRISSPDRHPRPALLSAYAGCPLGWHAGSLTTRSSLAKARIEHNCRMTHSGDRVPAAIVRASQGEAIPAAGIEHLFKLTGANTAGLFGLEEFVVPPDTLGARPHIHWGHDEYFYVLTGELTVATDAGEVLLRAGDLAQAGRGAAHGFRNASRSTPTTALCMYTPPGYEQYFRDVHAAVAAGTELTVDLLRDLRAGYDTDSL